MRRNLISCAVATAILAGCSSPPSDNDVKQIVEGMFGACPYFSLEKFKKVNSVAAGEGRYAVDVVFAVKVSPVSGAIELAEKGKADSAAIGQKLATATAQRTQAEATEGDYDAKIVQATRSGDRALETSLLTAKIEFVNGLKSLEQEIEQLQKQKRAIDSSVIGPLHAKINKECPNVHDMIRVYEPNNLDQFTSPFTKDFAGTLPLVKTEKGWRMAS